MRIKCLHGYFKFEEHHAGEINRLQLLFGFQLVPKNNYYTFSTLEDAPEYSLIGQDYLGVPATKLFAGKPWEVMRENGLVYDFVNDEVKAIESVTQFAQIDVGERYFLSPGLILPGSLTDEGVRVTEYSAWFLFDSMKFRYSEVLFE